MSTYQCEGFIKEVKIANNGNMTFTLEPAAPYLFERKKDDGATEMYLLFVESDTKAADTNGIANEQIKESNAKIIGSSSEFKASIPCWYNTLLVAKANRMRVRVEITWKTRLSKFVEVTRFSVI